MYLKNLIKLLIFYFKWKWQKCTVHGNRKMLHTQHTQVWSYLNMIILALYNYYDYLFLFKNLNKYILKLNKTNTNNNSLNNETRERNHFIY